MILKNLKEKRSIVITDKKLSTRAFSNSGNTSTRTIEGYASLYSTASNDNPSRMLGEFVDLDNSGNYKYQVFTERIMPGAFDLALTQGSLNVVHTVDHDRAKTVGRSGVNLTLSSDDTGLKYTVTIPQDGQATSVQSDLYRSINQGIYQESSFVFTLDDSDPNAQTWSYDADGNLQRSINKISMLFDTSTVLDGAYATGEAQARQRFARSLPETPVNEETKPEEIKVEAPAKEDPILSDYETTTTDLDVYILQTSVDLA
jgi:uncharacterized protein